MLKFILGMDPQSLDVKRENGPMIGMLQWHGNRMNLLVIKTFEHWSKAELEQVLELMRAIEGNGYKYPLPRPEA